MARGPGLGILIIIIQGCASTGNLAAFANNKATIYVPSTYHVNVPLPHTMVKDIVDGMCYMLAELAGGVTSTKAVGYYVARSGKLIKEEVTLLSVYTDIDNSTFIELGLMSRWLATSLQQEAVLMTIDHRAYLITEAASFVAHDDWQGFHGIAHPSSLKDQTVGSAMMAVSFRDEL